MTVSGAYGRDYKSAKAAREDWLAGKDFIIRDAFDPYDGKPVNREQVPGKSVFVRFAQDRKIGKLQ